MMAQPHDHLNETDEEVDRLWSARLEAPEENEPMSDYDESEKTFRWLGLAGIAAVTVVLLAMTSCEKVTQVEKSKSMAVCTSAGGSWLRAGDGVFHCLQLGAVVEASDAPLGVLP